MNQNKASVKPSKPENSKAVLKKMIALIKPYSVKMIVVIIFALLSTIFAIVGPKVMGQATTVLFEGLMAKVQELARLILIKSKESCYGYLVSILQVYSLVIFKGGLWHVYHVT
ncbi:hypothetical protein V2144_01060 [Erysipelothrix piscisicarius]